MTSHDIILHHFLFQLILFAGQDVETEFNDVWSISLKRTYAQMNVSRLL